MSLHAAPKRDSQIDCNQIRKHIVTRTHAGIEDLAVETVDEQIVVTGSALSFYVKQLATQATLEAEPGISFRNDIVVKEFPR